MTKIAMISMLATTSLLLVGCSNSKPAAETLTFPIKNTANMETGTVALKQLNDGGIEITVDIEGISPGSHAMHFHEIGLCEAPDFKSSGGHFNPAGVAHGKIEDGPHVGDMMNIFVDADGTGTFKVTNKNANLMGGDLPALLDIDGAALVIHAKADDYKSQPSGAAGARIACAVISGG